MYPKRQIEVSFSAKVLKFTRLLSASVSMSELYQKSEHFAKILARDHSRYSDLSSREADLSNSYLKQYARYGKTVDGVALMYEFANKAAAYKFGVETSLLAVAASLRIDRTHPALLFLADCWF